MSTKPKYATYIPENVLNPTAITGVTEATYKKMHDIYDGAPTEWARVRGATHTLWTGLGIGRGSRPAKMLKTVLYVGVDEVDDLIVWEKWSIRRNFRNENPVSDAYWRDGPDFGWYDSSGNLLDENWAEKYQNAS